MENELGFNTGDTEDSKPVFDFRNDYYKIIRWELVLFAKAYIIQDYEQCNRTLRDLYSNVQTFFTPQENDKVMPEFKIIRGLIKEALQNNKRDAAFLETRADAIATLEEKLMEVKQQIMDLLKKYNMLLPMSAGKTIGFDESTFMSQSDL